MSKSSTQANSDLSDLIGSSIRTKSKSKDSFLGLASYFMGLSLPKKVSVIVVLLTVVLLPLIVYVSYQQTQLDSKANLQVATPPIPNEVYLKFYLAESVDITTNLAKVGLLLDTHGRAVDGAQLVAYLGANRDLYSLDQQQLTIEGSLMDDMNVVTNKIEFQPEFNRYKLTLALISKNPAQPLTQTIPQVASFKVRLNPQADKNAMAVLSFDQAKTKVISHSTGENLAVNLPNFVITSAWYAEAVTPTATPSMPSATPAMPSATPAPTSQPIITPTPTPAPLPISLGTKLKVHMKFSDYVGNRKVYGTPPEMARLAVDKSTGKQVGMSGLYNDYRFVPGEGPGVVEIVEVFSGVDHDTQIDYYVKGFRHQAIHGEATLIKGKTAFLDLTNQPLVAGDLNWDYAIDLEDYHSLTMQFNPLAEPKRFDADLNYDGVVDISDYAILADNFDVDYTGVVWPSF